MASSHSSKRQYDELKQAIRRGENIESGPTAPQSDDANGDEKSKVSRAERKQFLREYRHWLAPYWRRLLFVFILALASALHREQTRKDTPVPYLAHLMAVARIVLEAGAYHRFDAIEDQGHRIGLDEIRDRFGDTVHDVVRDCSDAIMTEPDQPKAPWRERKEAYIEHIASASRAVLLVSAADKLHNARAILADYRVMGDVLWDKFNGGKENTLWYYRALVEAFRAAGQKALVDELDRTVTEIERLAEA